MQQLAAVWLSLSIQRRIVAVLGTLALAVTVLALSRAATTPSLALLYSGLEPGAAGDVVTALEQRGVPFEVRGGAIYADSALRDELRMTLAAEGMPATGGAGYELLDSLSGFGTTSQMFDAAYWRAKEGELARTIASSPAIRSARVHIASATNQGFRRDLVPSASVTLIAAGQGISAQQARAVRFLVASAVTGLSADAVSVIDAQSGLVLGGDDEMTPAGNADRSAELERSVERLLEARVGVGRALVEVSIDTVNEREQITERRVDPETRVAISTENEERTTQASDSRGGNVTVASNLPAGDASGSGGNSTSQNAETRERVNYEVSETQREIQRGPGGVRRLTVAVLVDGLRGTDASGSPTWEPRPEEELSALRELVASAVGFDEGRDDVITLKSMPFEALEALGTETEGSILAGVDAMSALQLATLALVALALGLFVVRPILAPRALPGSIAPSLPGPPPAGGTFELPSPGVGGAASVGGTQVFTGEIDDGADGFALGFPTVNAALPKMRAGASPDGDANYDPNDPVARLRRLISERQEETVEILRSWMDDSEERV